MKRRLFSLVAALAALSSAAFVAHAADAPYPDRPIKFVVPFPPGGVTDRIARSLAQKMSESMGQPVVVENKPGAGATIGTDFVARSKPDGYTILLGAHASHAINVSLMKLPYDAVKGFEPVSLLATVPNMLLVRPTFAGNSLRDLIAEAKKHPGKLTYTSAGVGTSGHIAGSLLATMAGVELLHVPARGPAQAVQDALGGHVDILFDSTALSLPLVNSGKLKALAVTSQQRSPAVPKLPTMAEAGLPGYEVLLWFGLYAPAGTPPAIVQRLHAETVKAFADAKVRGPLENDGVDVVAGTPQQLAEFQRAEIAKYAKLVKDMGLRPE
ncbi:tripartite tricarboxylate transporter substrate binding protein [Ramlibacter sp. USB13]|uniref:Tripartite tricarboxylate transporter substrate binding protein n=1 Tax=Ramlibacter cellulosilyticus TaxID=2764187 RepID=A0A923MM83_9BURK|nr:tripartite tricarboxylate transporter substrate binding protein [Ramlibacter cellulosilyticus]MBC5781356.1 tripartite tricarboxylate transporter substrate binding protein [Ramlibacter cellulosilyticus]